MNKAVIFDLDGTLLHTLPDIHFYVNEMLSHYGYPLRSEEEVMQFIGCGSRNLIKLSLPEGLTDDEISERHAYYNKVYTESGSPKTKLFDGIEEVLRGLKQRGYKLAILTNKPQETTDNVYERYMKHLGFDKVVGQSATVKVKPDPTTANAILREFDVLVENAYFVGDGETDVQTSINVKTNGIAVLWGYRTKEQLKLAGANVFANKPLDLLSLIK
ncbi:MAG: HAD family hydrolase [Clostridia bacterium]|nr:HAD family hydrolase [Clostridia bacterium]